MDAPEQFARTSILICFNASIGTNGSTTNIANVFMQVRIDKKSFIIQAYALGLHY